MRESKNTTATIEALRVQIAAQQAQLDQIQRTAREDAAEWFSIRQVAERWSVSVSTVRRLNRLGLIEFRKFTEHGKNYVDRDAVRRDARPGVRARPSARPEGGRSMKSHPFRFQAALPFIDKRWADWCALDRPATTDEIATEMLDRLAEAGWLRRTRR